MRCVDCPVYKYDGKRFTCPAHPYVNELDMFTNVEDCRAMKWYLTNLKDSEERYLYRQRILILLYNYASHMLELAEKEEGLPQQIVEGTTNLYSMIKYELDDIDEGLAYVRSEKRRIYAGRHQN